MSSKTFRRLIACIGFGVVIATPARAAEAPATRPAADAPLVLRDLVDGRLKVLTGRSAIVTTERPFKRVATPDNDVAVAKPLTTTTILVTPKKAGSTQLIVWDDDERSQIIDVIVELDTKALAEQLRALLPDSKVEASSANGTIVLKGRVPSAEAAKQAEQVAAPYGAKVLNFLEVSGGQQVMLQVRFAEVSRSATSALGVNLFAADGSFFGGSSIGQISPLTELPKARVGDTPAPIGVEFENNRAISPSVTIFAAGQIGSFYLDGLVQALRQNNLLRILDEPNLLTMSGKEADFLAGGSFPIPISGGAETGGSSTVTVEFREFGVKLKFLPVVIGDGKIRLQIAPEVSDLDFTTAVRFNGFVIPGLSQRRVNTTVELADGQSFAIAGLLANNVSATKETVPVLGDLPVVGALFRSVRYQRKETELIVLVTPRLVGPMNPGQVPKLPGEKWRHPKEKDLFLDADLGGPVAAKGPQDAGGSAEAKPPRFHGSYGFNPVTESDAK